MRSKAATSPPAPGSARKLNPQSPSQSRSASLFRRVGTLCRRIVKGAAPGDVHQLRTSIRRVETLLATRATDQHGALSKQLSRLRRRAGKVRDLDVQMAALATIHLETANGEQTQVMRALEADRTKRARKLVSAIERELDDGLRRRLRRAAAEVEASHRDAPHKDYAAQALRMFATVIRKYNTLTEQNLHELRLEGKRIRYLAEMDGTPRAEKIVAECRRIQDAIGEWHDWLTLGERAEEVLAKSRSPLIAAVRTARHAKFLEALRMVAEGKRELLRMRARGAKPARPPAFPRTTGAAAASA